MFKILKVLTLINLFFKGKLVGVDEYHNRYFELKSKDYLGRRKRICIYSGIVEASKIPAHWHAWMHHNSDSQIKYKHQFWMKSHTPDVTGTHYAFYPNKHTQFNIHGKFHIAKPQEYTPWDGTISDD